MTPKSRSVGPESEDRRTNNPAVSTGTVNGPSFKRGEGKRGDRSTQQGAKEAGVESLPDGEEAAAREAAKARDD